MTALRPDLGHYGSPHDRLKAGMPAHRSQGQGLGLSCHLPCHVVIQLSTDIVIRECAGQSREFLLEVADADPVARLMSSALR